MSDVLNDQALDALFREARSYSKWRPRPVTDETLRNLYDLLKLGPTSANEMMDRDRTGRGRGAG
jgi:3-hydroxypropanoate dehydrogenase